MCTNCLPYRDGHLPLQHPIRGDLPEGPGGSMSRSRFLKMTGGGLAAALAGTSMGLKLMDAQSNNLPYVVLIVLDGARRDYFDVSGLPHLTAMRKQGTEYTNAHAGILESETPSGHVTIGTGSEPRVTGIPSFWWADSHNTRISLFDPQKIRAGVMEKMIRKSGAPTLAGLVHGKNRKASVVALSGSKYYAADAIGGPDADITMYYANTPSQHWAPTYIPGHKPPAALLTAPHLQVATSALSKTGVQNHLAMRLAAATFMHTRQQVTLINLPEFDWPLGHVWGGSISQSGVKALMHSFDADLGMLQQAYHKAGVLNRTIFVIMSDHGMMTLTHKISKDQLVGAVTKSGAKIVSDTYTSAAYYWLDREALAPAAARNIANLGNHNIQSVYAAVKTSKGYVYQRVSSSKLLVAADAEETNQRLLQSFNGSNRPDVVVFFTEGTGCEPGGQSGWKADHGGSSWEAQHLPLVISGPGVQQGHVSHYPARLIDVAPTVLQLMGITPRRMQGTPLADAMTSTPSWAASRQKSNSKTLIPMVAAMQKASKAAA